MKASESHSFVHKPHVSPQKLMTWLSHSPGFLVVVSATPRSTESSSSSLLPVTGFLFIPFQTVLMFLSVESLLLLSSNSRKRGGALSWCSPICEGRRNWVSEGLWTDSYSQDPLDTAYRSVHPFITLLISRFYDKPNDRLLVLLPPSSLLYFYLRFVNPSCALFVLELVFQAYPSTFLTYHLIPFYIILYVYKLTHWLGYDSSRLADKPWRYVKFHAFVSG